MDIDIPVRGLEPLQPLGACLVLYLVFLMFLWLFLRPTVRAILRRRTLPRLLAALSLILARLLVFGLLLLGVLWALQELGWAEWFYTLVAELGDLIVEVPYLGYIGIPLLFLAALFFLYTIVRPVFTRRR